MTHCEFVVTGFGPFAGVEDNPTERLVHLLEDSLQQGGDAADQGLLHGLRTKVLRVAARSVREWLEVELFPSLRHAAPRPVVMVHLGVDAKSDCIRLELQACNDATFRVPDQDGWQPQRVPIEDAEGCPLDARLTTRLPVQALAASLNCKGYAVQTSSNAGRFVCNYCYFISLRHCRHGCKPPPPPPPPGGEAAGDNCDGGDAAAGEADPDAQLLAVGEAAGEAAAGSSQQQGRQGSSSCPAGSCATGAAAGEAAAADDVQPSAVGAAGSSAPDAAAGRCCGSGDPPPEEALPDWAEAGVGGHHHHHPRHALFVHVPPFSAVPERVQFDFLLDLLRLLARSVAAAGDATAGGIAAVDAAAAQAAAGEPALCEAVAKMEAAAVAAVEGAVEGAATEPEQGERAPTCAAPSLPLQQARWWAALLGCRVQ